MNTALSKATGAVAQLGARAAAVTGAYVAATAVMLLAVIVLRGMVAPALLRNVLGLIFLTSLSAGLEPGTIKAAALGEAGVEGADLVAYLAVGAMKGALASPLLAIIWRLADPTIPFSILAWTPLITIAGFWATDMRVLLDVRGRHTLAVGLKQGSLAGGVAIMGLLVALRTPLIWAVGVSTLARLALPLLVAALFRRAPRDRPVWREARRLLGDKRWIDLAAVSVIAAVGGSVDRVIGLRLLSPTDYGAYYLIYELLTKFWLIPFVLGPIVFARRASGEQSDSLVRGAWGLTAAAGAAFLAVVGGGSDPRAWSSRASGGSLLRPRDLRFRHGGGRRQPGPVTDCAPAGRWPWSPNRDRHGAQRRAVRADVLGLRQPLRGGWIALGVPGQDLT